MPCSWLIPRWRFYLRKKGITDIEKMDVAAVVNKYTVLPEKIVDIKGLAGDSSDNIPGVPGIGEKTAIKLIAEYGTCRKFVAEY